MVRTARHDSCSGRSFERLETCSRDREAMPLAAVDDLSDAEPGPIIQRDEKPKPAKAPKAKAKRKVKAKSKPTSKNKKTTAASPSKAAPSKKKNDPDLCDEDPEESETPKPPAMQKKPAMKRPAAASTAVAEGACKAQKLSRYWYYADKKIGIKMNGREQLTALALVPAIKSMPRVRSDVAR